MASQFNIKIHRLTGTGYERGWFLNCKARYRAFKGARNTKKSYDILGLEVLTKILSDKRRNILIVRNTQNSNKTTTFNQIVKLIYQPDPKNLDITFAPFFKINNSDLTITRKDTGQVIYFKGMDDAQKIQGIQVKFGYLTDIYVEAYDLTKENEDALIHMKKIEEMFKTTEPTYDSKYVGNWILQGQIVEPDKLFNPNKEHFMPDTKYKKLILYKDGTTNYDNVTWRDDYLIIESNGKIIDNRLYQETSKDGTRYLGIFMNDININARPYRYYYKEENND